MHPKPPCPHLTRLTGAQGLGGWSLGQPVMLALAPGRIGWPGLVPLATADSRAFSDLTQLLLKCAPSLLSWSSWSLPCPAHVISSSRCRNPTPGSPGKPPVSAGQWHWGSEHSLGYCHMGRLCGYCCQKFLFPRQEKPGRTAEGLRFPVALRLFRAQYHPRGWIWGPTRKAVV